MQILVSTPVTAPQLNAGSFGLSGPSHNVASILANAQLWLGVGLLLLVPAVLLRLLTRRLWAADLLGALIFSVFLGGLFILGTETRQMIAGLTLFFLTCLVWMRVLRYFGFLAILVIFSMGFTRLVPPVYTGWVAAQSSRCSSCRLWWPPLRSGSFCRLSDVPQWPSWPYAWLTADRLLGGGPEQADFAASRPPPSPTAPSGPRLPLPSPPRAHRPGCLQKKRRDGSSRRIA